MRERSWASHLSDHTDPGMLNMDEEKKLQGSLINGYAGGQEEQAGCIRRRLLPALNKHKKIIIGCVILNFIVAVVCFLLGMIHMSLNCEGDDIKCPADWIGHQGHCYKFSEEEKNWNESRNFCILHNASLAKITKKEMAFVRIFTRHHVFWIGLERHPPWKWLDGDNATSEIMGHGEGGGDCAYLDDSGKAYPGTCTTEHRFICKKK